MVLKSVFKKYFEIFRHNFECLGKGYNFAIR
jgi:hypothetical protein